MVKKNYGKYINKMLVTMSLTKGGWFDRFMKGNNTWTGVILRKYFDLYLESLHALLKILDRYRKEVESYQ